MKKLNVTLEDGTTAVLTVDGMFIEGMQFDGMDEIEGVREIRRASDVEFNVGLQLWRAVIRPEFRTREPFIYSAKKRSACIAWEREYLNGEEV